MQSETLLSLIGKIRVQRIRLAQHPKHSLTCTWTTDDELKFYEVAICSGSCLNSTEPTSLSSKPTSLPIRANRYAESIKKCSNDS